jgi:hypothetical protein
MTHPKQHGGWAAQATRRNEEYAGCTVCGQRSHRFRPESPVEEPVSVMRIAGYTFFLLVLFGSILYGLPIIGEALR